MKKKMRVAVIGATGAVGQTLLQILSDRNFPISELSVFASERSVGKPIVFRNAHLKKTAYIQSLSPSVDPSLFDFAFFVAGGAISEQYCRVFTNVGCTVIDNSSFFRMKPDVPLVIPEINGNLLHGSPAPKLIANPNCTTAQMVMVLKPILDHFGLERVVISSYQAVSGRGKTGVDELFHQAQAYLNNDTIGPSAFPHPIAFNCIPQVDRFEEDGFTGEEHKVMNETKKILGSPELKVLATCVRVPVFNGHSESVSVETKKDFSIDAVREILGKMKGVHILDDPKTNLYPLARNVTGKDDVFVGRIRKDPSLANGRFGLSMWIVADNLRKGAALNAVQIAECLV